MRYSTQVKPPLGRLLNPHHPLAKGLRGCWLLNENSIVEAFNVVGGGASRIATFAGANNALVTGGVYFGVESDLEVGDFLEGVDAPEWSIVSLVTCDNTTITEASHGPTLFSNDIGGWNDDVLFGVGCEGTNISTSKKLVCIHQEGLGSVRTVVEDPDDMVNEMWYHVATTSDGASLRLYKDGILRDTTAAVGTALGFNAADCTIGSAGPSSDAKRFWRGEVYYTFFYDRCLTNSEIKQLQWDPYCMFREDLPAFAPLNDFSTDASCVALWNFEDSPESFLEDSIGSNDLTNAGVDQDNGNYRVGVQAATFIAANTDKFTCADADQDVGFPFRYDDGGGMEKSFTVCFWARPHLISSTDYLWAKYDAGGGNRVIAIGLNTTGNNFKFNAGYNNGGDFDPHDHPGVVTLDRWYHVAFSYDSVTLEVRMRVWDDNGSALLDDDYTAVLANEIDECDTPLIMGTRDGDAGPYDGSLDEVVVFNRVLSVCEIDKIRKGIYTGANPGNDFTGDINCVALYTFESEAFAFDVKGTNHLTNVGADEDVAIFREGEQSAGFIRANGDYMTCADDDLDVGFPFRHADGGGVEKSFSACWWMRFPTLPTVLTEAIYPFSKYDTNGDERSIITYVSSSDDKFTFGMSNADGTSFDPLETVSALEVNTWYHVGVTYDQPTLGMRIRIWDDGAGTLLEADPTQTAATESYVADVPFMVGARGDQDRNFNGNLDELVIFNRVLTPAEIDEIRCSSYEEAAVTTAAPTTVAPTSLAPTTLAPTTLAPTSLAPTTLAPTTLGPTTIPPTTFIPGVTPNVYYVSAGIVPYDQSKGMTDNTYYITAGIIPYNEEVTTAAPTTAVPTTIAPTTIAPTTVPPTTVYPSSPPPPTSFVPTTAVPTTVPPTTIPPTTEPPIATTPPPTTTAAPTTVPPTTVPPTTDFTTFPPTTIAPSTIAPTTLAPTTLAPTSLAPTTLAPTSLAPTTQAPTSAAPTTAAPTTPAPTTVAPTTVTPTTLEPTTLAPSTLIPSTVAPTSVAPTTVAPTTIPPSSVPPSTSVPTTVGPTTAPPTTVAPTTGVPTTAGPTTVPPTSLSPTTLAPTTDIPEEICAKTCDSTITAELSCHSVMVSELRCSSEITEEIFCYGNLC